MLRALWRRPIALTIGVVLAFAVALSGMYRVSLAPPALHGRASTSGYALQRVLVDTPKSLVAAAQSKGSESIANKATLLGALTASQQARTMIARAAGLSRSEVSVVGPGALVPIVATPLAEKAIEVAPPPVPNVVTVNEDPGLPILSILATAADPGKAGILAHAATEALTSLGRRAMAPGGAVRIEPIGNATIGKKTAAGKAKPLIAGLGLLVFWCCAIIVFDALARRRRHLSGWAPEERVAA